MKLLNNIINKSNSQWLLLLFCLICSRANAQVSLINNGDFENYTICPSITNWGLPIFWYSAGKANYTGYFNRCSVDNCTSVPYNCSNSLSYQESHSGDGYIGVLFSNGGIGGNRRNYVATKLKDSLRQGKCYIVCFYANTCDGSRYGCSNISALISKMQPYVDTLFTPYGVLPTNPQIYNYGNPIIADTLNWVKISSIYLAQGGEQYLTLGNFKYDNQTSFKTIDPNGYAAANYYLDDVSVIPLDSMPLKADAGKDTSIAAVGDSVFIGGLTNGITNIIWKDANNNTINIVAPGFYVHPSASTFYIVEQTVCGYTSRDTVNVTVGTVPLKFISYNLVSSLRGTKQSIENIFTTANEINVSHYNIQRSSNSKDFTAIGTIKANNKNYNIYSYLDNSPPLEGLGVVYYRIIAIDNDGRKQYSTTQQITINHKQQTVNIYPNPASDIVNIQCQQAITQIKIINQLGQTIQQFNNLNNKQQTINIAKFTKGIYIVQLTTTNGEIIPKKLIIE